MLSHIKSGVRKFIIVCVIALGTLSSIGNNSYFHKMEFIVVILNILVFNFPIRPQAIVFIENMPQETESLTESEADNICSICVNFDISSIV